MTYVPIAPINSGELDTSSFEQLPETSNAKGFLAEASNTINNLPIVVGAQKIGQYINDTFKLSPFLSDSEAKAKYPNVSFPQGGYEYDIRMASEKKYQEDYNNLLLSNMAPGLLASGSRLAGTIAGFALSPVTWATGGITRPLVGAAEGAIYRAVGEDTLQQLITKVGLGVGEVNAVMTPFMISEKVNRDMIQEPMQAKEIFDNVLYNSIFGAGGGVLSHFLNGTINSVMGYRSVLPADTVDKALQVAQKQIDAGQKVDISPLVQEGLWRQNKENPIPDDNVLSDLQAQHKIIADKEIADSELKIKSLKQEQSGIISSLQEKSKEARSIDIQHKLYNEASLKIISHEDIGNINLYPQTGIEDELNKIINKGALNNDLLKNNKLIINNIDDLRSINLQHIKNIAIDKVYSLNRKAPLLDIKLNELETLQDLEANKERPSAIQLTSLSNDISGLNKKIDETKNTITNINKLIDDIGKKVSVKNIYSKEINSLVKKENEINLERQNIQKHIDIQNSVPLLQTLRDDVLPLDRDNLLNTVKKVNDYKNDLVLDEPELKKQDELLNTSDNDIDKELEDYSQILEEQYKDNTLSEDDKAEMEEDINENEKNNTIISALKSYLQCVISGGKE